MNIACKECHREYPTHCEQGICIDLYNSCIPCHFTPRGKNLGTQEQLQTVVEKEKLLRANILGQGVKAFIESL